MALTLPNKHCGFEIAAALATRFDALDDCIESKVGEPVARTFQHLQDCLPPDHFFVLFTPEANTRVVKDRRLTAHEERPAVMCSFICTTRHLTNPHDDPDHLESYMSFVDWAHFRVLEKITLPKPYDRANVNQETLEVPSDEVLGQLALRIRHFEYTFQVTRSGELG